ncbi:hypothetical protein DPMN_088769 [Dreissena polymorpha]|uniref:Uncharacterized protein n=1 Tax=Dreissena polymorpha TaxID=45954 RepID=A0A9D4KVK7_DREPO|nr:hypothetical protein DPMN_088769 [Dreissena polymorpha]
MKCCPSQKDIQGILVVTRTVNGEQVDDLCIARIFCHSLQDVRVKRGADLALDHHFLVARSKLKLMKSLIGGGGLGSQRHCYKAATLKGAWKKEEFKVTLSDKF